jgi:hypothetical protein
MMQYIILFLLLTNTSVDGNASVAGAAPLVFPTSMPPAAQIISNVLNEEISWRVGVDAFLNNSTNLTNLTQELIIA